ncbi:hypothetical protein GGR57DRAFT_321020 [Xylariaceae sp. FL1272]|nr:hypothetical protein GGR57DRAFT_321020 [Xylariaceae sp. FL1272]
MTSGRFAGDCRTASSSCAYATECADNTLYYDDDTSTKCFEGASCVLFTILQTSPDGWPSATNYGCRVAWSAYTVYRELATITSSTSTLATHTSALATSTTTRPVASQASSTSDINTNEKSSGRKALIIGAVVGPVLALVLVAALTWFIVRQRKRRGNAAEHFVPGMNEKDNHQYGGPILASELDGRQMPVEVATAKTPRMFEMSA